MALKRTSTLPCHQRLRKASRNLYVSYVTLVGPSLKYVPFPRIRLTIKRPKTLQKLCKECFYHVFETEIHNTIVRNNLFQPGEKVAIAASGGKDSTVLAHTMGILNKRYNYGIEFYLLSIDEGITGYRDDSLEVQFLRVGVLIK